ncbi:hypothetical protein HOY82DRAFT_383570 [Tuber indicum]|nr:hypothetical protein HOY82DRAFT_383570 [Tuber indicum]
MVLVFHHIPIMVTIVKGVLKWLSCWLKPELASPGKGNVLYLLVSLSFLLFCLHWWVTRPYLADYLRSQYCRWTATPNRAGLRGRDNNLVRCMVGNRISIHLGAIRDIAK